MSNVTDTSTKQKQAPAGPGTAVPVGTSELVRVLAYQLAVKYAEGWRAHAEHVGEPLSFSGPSDWAFCNSHAFLDLAESILNPNDGGQT